MVSHLSDRSDVVFDDERVIVNAGIVLAVALGRRLGIEALVDATVKLGGRAGASRPGRKVLSLMHAMLLGADCIDDCDVLRAGNTQAVLGHGRWRRRRWARSCAPSRLGTQLDRVLAVALKRAWQAGAGPGNQRLVVDVDSFVGEVHGHAKQGAGYGYTREAQRTATADAVGQLVALDAQLLDRDRPRHQRNYARQTSTISTRTPPPRRISSAAWSSPGPCARPPLDRYSRIQPVC